MDFELDAGQRAWLAEVRDFLRENVTAELRAELAQHDLESPGGEVARFRRKIGEKGWFGLNWPREYGGLEKIFAARPLIRDGGEAFLPEIDSVFTCGCPAVEALVNARDEIGENGSPRIR